MITGIVRIEKDRNTLSFAWEDFTTWFRIKNKKIPHPAKNRKNVMKEVSKFECLH